MRSMKMCWKKCSKCKHQYVYHQETSLRIQSIECPCPKGHSQFADTQLERVEMKWWQSDKVIDWALGPIWGMERMMMNWSLNYTTGNMKMCTKRKLGCWTQIPLSLLLCRGAVEVMGKDNTCGSPNNRQESFCIINFPVFNPLGNFEKIATPALFVFRQCLIEHSSLFLFSIPTHLVKVTRANAWQQDWCTFLASFLLLADGTILLNCSVCAHQLLNFSTGTVSWYFIVCYVPSCYPLLHPFLLLILCQTHLTPVPTISFTHYRL